MQDTCRILAYSAAADEYGNPDPAWTPGEPTACGFEPTSPDELHGTGEVPVIDAKVRLPIDTEVDERDRVRLTHRCGEALATAEDYEIAGPPKRGPTGLVLDLRRATDA